MQQLGLEAKKLNLRTPMFKAPTLPIRKTRGPYVRWGNNTPYRDRAVERRSLHGEYGIGTGQKNFLNTNLYKVESAPQASHPEEAVAEVLNMTFGKGEALESSSKGMMEPLQAVANKGNAGLGWSNVR